MPEYIDSIFNYCDRWCERCAFTARCRAFADEERFLARVREWDEFWSALEKAGCDLSPPEPPAAKQEVRKPRPKKRRKPDALKQAAEEYMDAARAWLKEQPEFHRDPDIPSQPDTIEDMLDVIAWYHTLITAKLHRALSGLRTSERLQPWEQDEIAEFDRQDADGSAKVVLISIERSLGAWTLLRTRFHRDEDTARRFIGQLARLRQAVEERFPNARVFQRPGFDD